MATIYSKLRKLGNSHYMLVPKQLVEGMKLHGKRIYATIHAQDDSAETEVTEGNKDNE